MLLLVTLMIFHSDTIVAVFLHAVIPLQLK